MRSLLLTPLMLMIGSSALSEDLTHNEYFNRGMNKIDPRVRDYKGAELDFTKAIELNPTNDDYYFWRSSIRKLYLKDRQGACLDYQKQAELGSIYGKNKAGGRWCKKLLDEIANTGSDNEYLGSSSNAVSGNNIKIVTPEQEATCLKAQDYKGCMEYYSQSPKRKGGTGKAILRAIGAGLSGVRVNTSPVGRPAAQPSYTPKLTPYNPNPPTFQKYSNEYNQMWNPR